jgi:hypothetical protein
MWKDFLLKLMLMPIVRDSFNFVLRYTLAQPVDIDFVVALGALFGFTGISEWFASIEESDEEDMLISIPQLEPIGKHQEF